MGGDLNGAATTNGNTMQETFSGTSGLAIALVTWIIYWFFLRPRPVPLTIATATATTPTSPRPRTPAAAARRPNTPRGGFTATRPTTSSIRMSEAAMEVLQAYPSQPSHLKVATNTGLGGSNVISSESGLIQFAATQASATTTIPTVRQDRAKLLSYFCNTETPPPSKGSTIVVSISQSTLDQTSPVVSRALYALATFYNVVVIISVDHTGKLEASQKSKLISKLRGSSLTTEILPDHRVVWSTTLTGRVALVRQLSKVALVVDFETDARDQLSRFGYAVQIVKDWKSEILL